MKAPHPFTPTRFTASPTQKSTTQHSSGEKAEDAARPPNNLHGPRGIHAQQTRTRTARWDEFLWDSGTKWNQVGEWQHMLTDGLGSVRSVIDWNTVAVNSTAGYQPYGTPDTGSSLPTDFG